MKAKKIETPTTLEEDYQDWYYNQQLEKAQEKKKETKSKYNKDYYEINKEKYKEYMKKYYEKNKEKKIEYNKQYREKNKEKLAEQKMKYDQEHKEQISAYNKKIYQKKKDLQVLIEAMQKELKIYRSLDRLIEKNCGIKIDHTFNLD